MNVDKIFLVATDRNELQPLQETEFQLEEDLRRLLVRYWDLLPGDQINQDAPRRWLLVTDEMPVPDTEDGARASSLDHLFLDQDGIPTFVECKRSSDTKARREVVAEMLEYAAYGGEYWDVGRIREAFQKTCRTQKRKHDEELRRVLGPGNADVEGYWKSVERNLAEGRLRLLFVTDEAPKELRRLTEFLNRTMPDVEVLIVEIRQFLGAGQRLLVPRVIGRVEQPRPSGPIDSNRFLSQCNPAAAKLFKQILHDCGEAGLVTNWGRTGFSVGTESTEGDGLAAFAYGSVPHQFMFNFEPRLALPEAESAAVRRKLLDFAVFKETELTLTADVDGNNLPSATAAWKAILGWAVTRAASGHSGAVKTGK